MAAQQPDWTEGGEGGDVGKGRMGSALMGSLQISCFWQRDFLGTPINLLLYSQKCQGVPFSPICQTNDFCSGPISVDPISPQPKMEGMERGGEREGESWQSTTQGNFIRTTKRLLRVKQQKTNIWRSRTPGLSLSQRGRSTLADTNK